MKKILTNRIFIIAGFTMYSCTAISVTENNMKTESKENSNKSTDEKDQNINWEAGNKPNIHHIRTENITLEKLSPKFDTNVIIEHLIPKLESMEVDKEKNIVLSTLKNLNLRIKPSEHNLNTFSDPTNFNYLLEIIHAYSKLFKSSYDGNQWHVHDSACFLTDSIIYCMAKLDLDNNQIKFYLKLFRDFIISTNLFSPDLDDDNVQSKLLDCIEHINISNTQKENRLRLLLNNLETKYFAVNNSQFTELMTLTLNHSFAEDLRLDFLGYCDFPKLETIMINDTPPKDLIISLKPISKAYLPRLKEFIIDSRSMSKYNIYMNFSLLRRTNIAKGENKKYKDLLPPFAHILLSEKFSALESTSNNYIFSSSPQTLRNLKLCNRDKLAKVYRMERGTTLSKLFSSQTEPVLNLNRMQMEEEPALNLNNSMPLCEKLCVKNHMPNMSYKFWYQSEESENFEEDNMEEEENENEGLEGENYNNYIENQSSENSIDSESFETSQKKRKL